MEKTLLPFDDLATDDEMRRLYGSVTVTPRSTPDWAFRMVLPKDWMQDEAAPPAPPEPLALTQLAAFAAPDHAQRPAGVQVWAALMPFEVNVSDWLDFYAEGEGMEILEKVARGPEAGDALEALAHLRHGGQEMLARLTVYGDGDRLFVVAGMAAENLYESAANKLAIAALSFEPVSRTGRDFMEEVAEYEDDAGRVAFLHPASWKALKLPSDPSVTGVALRLEGDDELLGYLRVQTLDQPISESGERVIESIRLDLEASGVGVSDPELVEEDGEWGEELWVGDADIDGTPNEYVVTLKPFTDGGARPGGAGRVEGVACVLLAPPREREPHLWMRCKRALEIVVATARPAG